MGISLIIIFFAISFYTTLGSAICARIYIIDDIIDGKYKFKMKHIPLIPSIIVIKYIDKQHKKK